MFSTPATITLLTSTMTYPKEVLAAYQRLEASTADYSAALVEYYNAEAALTKAQTVDRAALAESAAKQAGPPKPADIPKLEAQLDYQREVVVQASDRVLACNDTLKHALREHRVVTLESSIAAARASLAAYDRTVETAKTLIQEAGVKVQEAAHGLQVMEPFVEHTTWRTNFAPPSLNIMHARDLGNIEQICQRIERANLEAQQIPT